MLNLTSVQPTWKSPLSDAPRLSAEVLPRELLTRADQREMYQLLETYFENTSFGQFEQDLAEKDFAILLRDPYDGHVVGFSTLMTLWITVQNRQVAGFFSGDTIIARERWGSRPSSRLRFSCGTSRWAR